MLKRKILAALIAASFCGAGHAAIDINGFASIKGGMALSSDDQLYGYDNDFSFRNESLAALQVKSDLGDKLSVTAQIIGRGKQNWETEFEGAFLSYTISDNWSVNAGLLRTPFFKYSDYLDVGYAYDWSRTPQSVYGFGFDNLEGAAFIYTSSFANYDSNIQFVAGSQNDSFGVGADRITGDINNVVGAIWELSQDTHSFRLIYLDAKVTLSSENLDGFVSNLSGLGLSTVAEAIDVVEEQGVFMGFAFTLDKNDWILVSEVTETEVKNSFRAKSRAYYLSIGHRFGKSTPYVSFENEDGKSHPEIYANLPTTSAVYSDVVALVNSQTLDRRTINAGLRYDFHPSAAFKAQYTIADNKTADRKDSIFVVGVDLVF